MRRLALILALAALVLVAVRGIGPTLDGAPSVERETGGDLGGDDRTELVRTPGSRAFERFARRDGFANASTLDADTGAETDEVGHPSSRGVTFVTGRLSDPEGNVLAVGSGGRVLATLHDLEIRYAETCRDPRLAEIIVSRHGS